ncbi:MAG: hypothetical protein RL653_3478 [Pseudomonadota bacterium]|jgi:hypothetical protein
MRPLATLMLLLSGCTASTFTRLPAPEASRPFITAEGLPAGTAYDSVGIVQVTRRGVLVFGFADPAGTELDAALADLEMEARKAGADGVVNARVVKQPWTLAERIAGAVLFFAPFPSEVTMTGELVRLRRESAGGVK